MINDIVNDAEKRMHKSLDILAEGLAKMRTGRANPGLLEHIMVSYYGNDTPLSQVATINATDARTLTVTPWEGDMIGPIEKAIITSDLGLNPATSGRNIRVPLPALTEERRKKFVKLVRDEAEKGRVSIRNIRRDANGDLKGYLKEKEISEDDERRGQGRVQELTDTFVTKVDALLKEKEEALMQV